MAASSWAAATDPLLFFAGPGTLDIVRDHLAVIGVAAPGAEAVVSRPDRSDERTHNSMEWHCERDVRSRVLISKHEPEPSGRAEVGLVGGAFAWACICALCVLA